MWSFASAAELASWRQVFVDEWGIEGTEAGFPSNGGMPDASTCLADEKISVALGLHGGSKPSPARPHPAHPTPWDGADRAGCVFLPAGASY